MIDTLVGLFSPYRELLPWIGWISAGLFLVSLAVVPELVARIPANYFLKSSTTGPKTLAIHYPLVWVLRNLIALILILAGIVMLILPGQGILTIVLGIFVADFPGKLLLERKLVANRSVFNAINWIRTKKGAPELCYPDLSPNENTQNKNWQRHSKQNNSGESPKDR